MLYRSVRHQQGMVLILVLWMMILMSIMLVALSASVDSALEQTITMQDRVQARAMAEGAIAYSAFRTDEGQLKEKTFPTNGQLISLAQLMPDLTIRLRGVEGYINPNSAEPALLEALIKGVIVAGATEGLEGNPTEIADNIRQFIYPDEGRDPSQGGRYRPLYAIEEVRQIKGITEALFQGLRPHLSIASQNTKLNVLSASAELLKLVFSDTDASVIDQYVVERDKAILNQEKPPVFPMTAGYVYESIGQFFEAQVSVPLANGGRYNARALVQRLGGNQRDQLRITQWRDQ